MLRGALKPTKARLEPASGSSGSSGSHMFGHVSLEPEAGGKCSIYFINEEHSIRSGIVCRLLRMLLTSRLFVF